MVVDDSAVVRGLETRILESDPAISVIASVGNGQAAVQALDRHDVEVIVLDIEMPVMDGITALPLLLKKAPNVKIVMSSTLTARNADISLKALEAGASDYVTKPSSSRELTGGQDFKAELVAKVKVLGAAARKASGGAPRVTSSPAPRPAATVPPRAPPSVAASGCRQDHAARTVQGAPPTSSPSGRPPVGRRRFSTCWEACASAAACSSRSSSPSTCRRPSPPFWPSTSTASPG